MLGDKSIVNNVLFSLVLYFELVLALSWSVGEIAIAQDNFNMQMLMKVSTMDIFYGWKPMEKVVNILHFTCLEMEEIELQLYQI